MAAPRPLPQPAWDTEQVCLKDMLMKYELPMVSKVMKGQFMNIGISKFNPLKKLHQDVMVHSIKTGLKVLGHSVMRVDGRDGRSRLVALEQRLSIPITYRGWFELLSEDGRSVRPIEGVHQLFKLYPEIKHVLVRQNIKAYLANESDGKMTFDKTRIVISGEQLKLTGDFSLQMPASFEGKVRLLKCIDTKGDTVYLSFDQKGVFTPIAGDKDVMGVFLIKDVINRFRMPLTVKLVQGVWPKVDSNRFSGIIRLDWAYTDEIAFVCPLDKSAPRIYTIPTEVNLRLVTATNNNELKDDEVFTNIIVKCNRLVHNYHNTIHLIIAVPEGAIKAKNHTFANMYSKNNAQEQQRRSESQMKRSRSREDILHDELDDLYGYLREGKQPPIEKFKRDSDEETFYEEPEFEPMTKFKSRLAMLEKGNVNESKQGTGYNFVDPRAKLDANHNAITVTIGHAGSNGHVMPKKSGAPPELPPRQYKRSGSVPLIHQTFNIDGTAGRDSGSGKHSGSGSGKQTDKKGTGGQIQERPISKERQSKTSRDSKSSGSAGRQSDTVLRDRESRSSKSGSAKGLRSRKSMPLLYL